MKFSLPWWEGVRGRGILPSPFDRLRVNGVNPFWVVLKTVPSEPFTVRSEPFGSAQDQRPYPSPAPVKGDGTRPNCEINFPDPSREGRGRNDGGSATPSCIFS